MKTITTETYTILALQKLWEIQQGIFSLGCKEAQVMFRFPTMK